MADTPKTGIFCWQDLMTPDPDRSRAFYSELIGWDIKEMPMGEEKFLIAHAGEQMVAGLMPNPQKGVPPNWMPYVTVADIDAANKKAEALGGKVMMPGKDIPEIGRFSVIVDPEGAVIAPFKGLQDPPDMPEKPPRGTFCWYEIVTKDPEAAKKFYTGVFDWTIQSMPMGDAGKYEMFVAGEKQVAGVMPMPDHPPAWLSYIAVDDLDDTTRRVSELGGKVHNPPTDIPGVGRFSVIGDSLEGVVALFHGA